MDGDKTEAAISDFSNDSSSSSSSSSSSNSSSSPSAISITRSPTARRSTSPPPVRNVPSSSQPSFHVGDVVMAKLDAYLFWPGMVTFDPEKYVHQGFGKVHVSFFDEPPSRGWAPIERTFPFTSPDDAEALLVPDEPKMPTSMELVWKRFVGVAAEAARLAVEERIEKYLELQEFSPPNSDDESENPTGAAHSFPVGSIVLAKMRGYPYWPGIVSLDPLRQRHVVSNSIHVHFLGNPIVRGWASIKGLHHFFGRSSQLYDLVEPEFRKDGALKASLKMAKEALKENRSERLVKYVLQEIGNGRDKHQFDEIHDRINREEDWEKELEE